MRNLRQTLEKESVAGYIFVLPFIIGLMAFTAIPFFTSLYLSFTQYDSLSDPKWIGIDNYIRMFTQDKLFWKSFWVTFKFAFIQVPVKLAVSLGVALLLSCTSKLTSVYCGAFYIPSLLAAWPWP